jgi:hypothetical protein
MTQAELTTNIYKFMCCSGNMAEEVATLLVSGDKSCKTKIDNILLINDYIDQLVKYDLTVNANNCLTTNEFDLIYNNASVLCKLCDC